MREQFKNYLIKKGYKQLTPTGNPSTVSMYIQSIEYVCNEESTNWNELANKIDVILPIYNIGGKKETLGNKSHKTVINALKRFKEFILTT